MKPHERHIIALTLLLLPMAAHAADCKPPDVARVVVVHPKGCDPSPVLSCPAVGVCRYFVAPNAVCAKTSVQVLCLSDDEHKKALER